MRKIMTNLTSTLVVENLGGYEWWEFEAAANGSIYGIPKRARQVVKFDPVDKSKTHIGPDFGNGWKWHRGAMTPSGVMYCPPFDSHRRGILKIDTNTDNVTEFDVDLLPEVGGEGMWVSCAVALDGCIYFMPTDARRIMKLDPNNNDAMTSVGDDLGKGYYKYLGTVIGMDGCVYGIPFNKSDPILKYDPINDTTSFVGEEADKTFIFSGNGVLARDGCIYVLTKGGRILKIDATNNSHCFVRNSIKSYHHGEGWGDGILGIDGCIYWPPAHASRILKYDPHTNQASLVGDHYGGGFEQDHYYKQGCLASDGVIYCFSEFSSRILTIDPWKEFLMNVKKNIEEYPQNFGFIFERTEKKESSTMSLHKPNIDHQLERTKQTTESSTLSYQQPNIHHHEAPRQSKSCYNAIAKFVQNIGFQKAALEENTTMPPPLKPPLEPQLKPPLEPPLHHVSRINFDHAVVKFGEEKLFEGLEKHMAPVNDFCKHSNLCPFMLLASCKEISVGTIYHFLCEDLSSWINGGVGSLEVKAKGTLRAQEKIQYSPLKG